MLMKDLATQDFAFTFGLNGSARNVGLWAHQSILAQKPALARVIEKLKVIEGDTTTDPGSARSVKSTHVTEYTLASYCSLVRYLYTGDIALEIDLSDFAIGYPPNKPFSPSCKNRIDIDILLPLKSSLSTDLSSGASSSESTAPKLNEPPVESRMVATWNELFKVADCYQVTELRQYCQNKIVKDLGEATSLDVLFGFAYRYSDLKAIVIQNVADNMSSLYAVSQDPLIAYADHPEKFTLLSEALHLMFKAKTQI